MKKMLKEKEKPKCESLCPECGERLNLRIEMSCFDVYQVRAGQEGDFIYTSESYPTGFSELQCPECSYIEEC